MALVWMDVGTPSIHGITRLRCGLYLCIESTPDSWFGVKMGCWQSDKGLTREQAIQECEIHYLTERLRGNSYKPNNRNSESTAIGKVWHQNGETAIPEPVIHKLVSDWQRGYDETPSKAVEDAEDQTPPTDQS